MHDPEIRAAVARRIAVARAGQRHLLVDEVDVRYGYRRMDALLVEQELTAFEIKSDFDSLTRLSAQADAYSLVADRAVLVAGSHHLNAASAAVPPWWEVWNATGSDRGVRLRVVRRGRRNTSKDPVAVAGMLLRDELLDELRWYDVPRLSRRPVDELREVLAASLTLSELSVVVTRALERRPSWRQRALSWSPGEVLAPRNAWLEELPLLAAG